MTTTFERLKQKLTTGVSSDGRPSRKYTLGYLCKSDSLAELSVADVQSLLGLSAGTPFSDDPNATLGDIDIDRLPTIPPHCKWNVTLVYATNAKVPENTSDDPTQMRVKRTQRYAEFTKHIIKDRLGSLIVNAAKEPFAEGIPVSTYPNSYVYEWNRAIPTRGFHETVNLNRFNGCNPGTLLCLITKEEQFEGAWSYWHETIEMRYNPNGWNPQPLNAGTKKLQYDVSEAHQVPCVDGRLQPYSQPQPLYDGTITTDVTKQAGMMIPLSDRPDGCVYINVDHFVKTKFEEIGVREFPE